jgi:hypothetical protein
MACLGGFFSIVARPVVVVFMRDPSIARVANARVIASGVPKRPRARNCLIYRALSEKCPRVRDDGPVDFAQTLARVATLAPWT